MNDNAKNNPFRVGDWLVEPDTGCVRKNDQVSRLEPKVMDLLVFLTRNAGKVLSREELEQTIWAGTVVGYDALTSAIIKLRKALEDDSRNPWLIETVPKKGYRFIATISSPAQTPAPESAAITVTPATTTSWTRRYIPWLAAFTFIVIAIVISWLQMQSTATHTATTPSIVVLPFTNLSGDSNFEYFSDGITEDITTDLSKLSGLLVIAPNSANNYKNQPLSINSVAQALGVQYVLEGSVRRNGKEIRVTAKLIDAESGKHLWAERYDRQLKDIFSLQDELTHSIVNTLALTLTDDEKKQIAHRYTQSVEAYDLLLQGQSLYARSSKEDNAKARERYLSAIQLDSKFARAFAALALTHAEDFRFNWSKQPAKSLEQAITLAHQAVALDDAIPQTSQVLGYVLVIDKQYDAAVNAAERAIRVDPNNADAYTTLAFGRVYQNRNDDAIKLVRQAMRLNPHYPAQYPSILGRAYYHKGQYDEAAIILREAIDKNPVRAPPRLYLILTYVALDKLDDANWEVEQLNINTPDVTLDTIDQALPAADQTVLAKMRDDLRRAGLK